MSLGPLGAPHPSAAQPIRSTQRRIRPRGLAALGCGAPGDQAAKLAATKAQLILSQMVSRYFGRALR